MRKPRNGEEGDFLEIEISPNRFVYARKLMCPIVALYEGLFTDHCIDIDGIMAKPILIKLCVFTYAIAKKRWKLIGNKPLDKDLQSEVKFWKKEYRVVSDEDCAKGIDPGFDYYIYTTDINTPDGGRLLHLISEEERRGLAKYAVYTPEYIEECLRKHYGIDEQNGNTIPKHLYDSLLSPDY